MSKTEDLQPSEEMQQEVKAESAESETTQAPPAEGQTFDEKVEALTAELNQALNDAETHKDIAIRAKAEQENIRRRAEREISNASKFALERFAREILAVVDSLEQALEHPVVHESQKSMREGIELTYKLLVDTLNKFAIEQISPLGDTFDPGLHEAIVMQESAEHEPNSVMQVVQMGYSLNGRLIRPARVIVAKGKAPQIDEKA